jgi:hypothetical protein
MTGLILEAALLFSMGMQIQTGYAVRYDPNVMERVAIVRGMEQQDCMVSSPVFDIGSWLYVYGKNTKQMLLCQVVDTSHPKDKPRHLQNNLIVELGYNNAIPICGGLNVPRRDCAVIVSQVSNVS